MGLFEHFPYCNFHGLNLDWLMKKVKELEEKVEIHNNWIGNWSVCKDYHWERTDSDHSGGSLIAAKSDNCWMRSVRYRITGRIIEYEIVFYPDPNGTFPMTGEEIWFDMPGWIYGYPYTFNLKMNDPDLGLLADKGDYLFRTSDSGKLRVWVRNPERHQYSVHGWIVKAESLNEPSEVLPN